MTPSRAVNFAPTIAGKRLRPWRALLAVLVVVSLALLPFPAAGVDPDTTGPTFTALAFSTTSIDNSTAVTITVTATITDDTAVRDRFIDPNNPDASFEGPSITFSAPRGDAYTLGFFERTSGDAFSAQVTFAQYAALGSWTASVGAADLSYNWTSLSAGDLAGLGFPSTVTASGIDDVTPPTLVSLSAPVPSVVDVGDCDSLNRRVVLDAVVSDDLSGFSSGYLAFAPPSGNFYQAGFDPSGDGHYLVAFDLATDAETGIWTPYDASIADVVGNTAGLSAGDLPAVSFEVTRTFHGGPPGAPTNVTAAAGDGTASLSWLAPLDDGGSPITGYGIGVTRSDQPNQGAAGGVDGSVTTTTFTNLVNGVAYTFEVSAGNLCGTSLGASATVTPEAGASAPQTTSATIPATGGSATTDPSATGPTPSDPVTTSVIVPATAGGGSVTIAETAIGDAPTGWVFLGQQVEITSTAATDAANPLTIVFNLDPSLVPATIFKDGVPVGATCEPAGTATPSPCIASGAGTSQVTVLTASASTWNVGVSSGVTFAFTGFLAETLNPPKVNQAKAGDTIKLQFGLGGDVGMNIFAAGYPASADHACGSVATEASDATRPGKKGLTFQARAGVYTYWWSTSTAWKKTCRTFVLKLSDDTYHYAEFRFK